MQRARLAGLRTGTTLVLAIATLAVATSSVAADSGPVLSVDECVAMALREHPDLQAASASVKEAEFGIGKATAPLLPHVAAQYSAVREKQTLAALIEGPSNTLTRTDDTFTFQAGRFQLTQLLFDFGRSISERRAVLDMARSKHSDRRRTEQTIALGVKVAYYQLVAAHRLEDVAARGGELANLELATARSRHKAGLTSGFDETRQEVQLANAELRIVTARNNIELARETLRVAIGVTEPLTFTPDDRALDTRFVEVDENAALTRAYAARPELASLTALKSAQEYRISALSRSYLPIAVGRAEYNFTGNKADDEGWQIGALIRLSIFDGGATASELGQLRAQLTELEATERRTRNQVAFEVRESILQLRRVSESLGLSTKVIEAAEESTRLAGSRYRSGVGNIIELTDAQVDLASARANHVRLLADYRIGCAQLDYAVGGVLAGDRASSG